MFLKIMGLLLLCAILIMLVFYLARKLKKSGAEAALKNLAGEENYKQMENDDPELFNLLREGSVLRPLVRFNDRAVKINLALRKKENDVVITLVRFLLYVSREKQTKQEKVFNVLLHVAPVNVGSSSGVILRKQGKNKVEDELLNNVEGFRSAIRNPQADFAEKFYVKYLQSGTPTLPRDIQFLCLQAAKDYPFEGRAAVLTRLMFYKNAIFCLAPDPDNSDQLKRLVTIGKKMARRF